MLNIFNLFLFLLTLWFVFMFVGHDFSIPFLIFGIISSLVISIISYQLKLINNKSELLYLSLGFYHHFFGIYFKNFFKSMNLVLLGTSLQFEIKKRFHSVYISRYLIICFGSAKPCTRAVRSMLTNFLGT